MNSFLLNPTEYPLTPAIRRASMQALTGGLPAVGLYSLAELRAFPVADCFDDRVVLLACHTDVADSGGGVFIWRSSETRADNNGTIITPTGYTGLGRWVRLDALRSPDKVDITWFGAKSGVLGVDNAPAINAAIQSLPLYGDASLVINGGYMRRGVCGIPAGEWFISTPVIASGGMWVRGEGTSSTRIRVNPQSPAFGAVQTLTVTTFARDSGTGLTTITFSAPHGIPVGNQFSGLLEGLPTFNCQQYTNGFWWRFLATTATQATFWSGFDPGSLAGSTVTVEFEQLILDFQISTTGVAWNDVFGTRCSDISLTGGYTRTDNPSSSGLWIVGAQNSSCIDVNVSDVGIRGVQLEVPSDRVWVANVVRGPGIYCTTGYMKKHLQIHSEHVNQGAVHMISDIANPPVPRPAFMFANLHGVRIDHIQGEDSPLEIMIRNCTQIYFKDLVFNAGGENETINGYATTLLHISGLSNTFSFEGVYFSVTSTQGYAHLINDITFYANAQGESGYGNDFRSVSSRAGANWSWPMNPILLGPFQDDGIAASKGVPLGAAYRALGGVIVWRSRPGPYADDTAANLAGVPADTEYVRNNWGIYSTPA